MGFRSMIKRGLAPLAVAILAVFAAPAEAARITVTDERNQFTHAVNIHVSGEFTYGDTAEMARQITALNPSENSFFTVTFDSPGGSLHEGLEMGRYLANLPAQVATDVARGTAPAECASACVFAYMGGHFRYMRPGSQLGVHQFYVDETTSLTVWEGMSVSQELAGDIVRFMMERGVDPALYTLISRVGPMGMYWLEPEDLIDFRVVTGMVRAQSAEWRHQSGRHYLLLTVDSATGRHQIAAQCTPEGEVLFSAYLDPHILMPGGFDPNAYRFEVVIDGQTQPPAEMQVLPPEDHRSLTLFTLSPAQLAAIGRAQSFGARYSASPTAYLGLDYRLEERDLADLVASCGGAAPRTATPQTAPQTAFPTKTPPAPAPARDQRHPGQSIASGVTPDGGPIVLENTDVIGGDYDRQGISGITPRDCYEICLSRADCLGYSYVEASNQCFPKHRMDTPRQAPGITTLILPRR
ncbi:MAG: PAN domain-containing protein [Paracoccus sp. (in: a-proteobacteria)]|nr:PAN domain-containing protein [Paracoccus sp. (in: a-proteobacteria)]